MIAKTVLRRMTAMVLALVMSVTLLAVYSIEVSAAATDLYVGFSSQSNNYSTVQAAVNAAKSINPKSEANRVYIHIAPGTYREQIIVNTPYISFVNDTPSQQVLLTWYYGIGYKYYSCDDGGYYNASSAASKSAKYEPTSRWGCSVGLRGDADYFRAEGITFENSFNRYITKEELADGVEVAGSQAITFARTSTSLDVSSKAATERAAALSIDSDYCEFYNCSFYSSQDTLYAGGSKGYFNNCLIEGNTDYIFGKGDYVFQNTELSFKGYSSGAAGGYITAAREQSKGYLFYDCTVTANSSLTVNPGYFGRPWRNTAAVAFVNTVLQYEGIISKAGWYKMSDVTPEMATFREYGTKTASGSGVNTSSRTSGTVLSSASGYTPTDYFGNWTPYYYGYSGGGSGGGEQDDLTQVAILNADDIAEGSYSANIVPNPYFTITVENADAVVVDANGGKTSSDNAVSITKRIKLGGVGTTSNRSIRINAPDAGTVKIYMMSSNSADSRTANLLDSSGNTIASVANVGGSQLSPFTFTIPSAGVYYIASASSGINVYYATLYSSGETELVDPPEVLVGDVNLDGLLDIRDVAMLAKAAGKIVTLSGDAATAADVTLDGSIDIRDVAKLAKSVAALK